MAGTKLSLLRSVIVYVIEKQEHIYRIDRLVLCVYNHIQYIPISIYIDLEYTLH